MKILLINVTCGTGSTGRIVADTYRLLKTEGHDGKIAYGRGTACGVPIKDTYKIGSNIDIYVHALMSRITDRTGFYSRTATKRFIRWIKFYNPDLIHLHNIHGYYVNIDVLFNFLKSFNKPVVWTLHDCWAFTGHCAHFDYSGCVNWKTECHMCPQTRRYPSSYVFDRSNKNYWTKKELFTNIESMTIITPSEWLADIVLCSFLSSYVVRVINNGIDLEVFKPTNSDFRERYGLFDEIILLGVAAIWDERKGLRDLIELSKLLEEQYKIVVIGVSQKQLASLPENMVGIPHTNSVTELAQIYTASDVFINPTHEDNFPTVNIEALACGTPVITYNTGGSREAIGESCGLVLEEKTPEAIKRELGKLQYNRSACMNRAQHYKKENRFSDCLDMYKALIKS